MLSLKSSRIILFFIFFLAAIAGGYAAYHYYAYLCKSARLNFIESQKQTVIKIRTRVEEKWLQSLEQLLHYAQRMVTGSPDQISKSLQVIVDSQDEMRHAFFIDREVIYLPQWKKFRITKSTEDLSLPIFENTEFKQAELLEFQYQDFTEAVKIYERFWLENPNNFRSAHALARCLLKADKFKRSENIYLQIYNQNPALKIQGDMPLAITAAFQLLTIYQKRDRRRDAQAFSLQLYHHLLDERWELTKIKTRFFQNKLKTYMEPYLSESAFSRKYRKLLQRERRMEKSKSYVRFISQRVIPFIESSPISGYRVYFPTSPDHQPTFLLIIPHRQGHIVLDIEYMGFVRQHLFKLATTLGQDHALGMTLRFSDQTEHLVPMAGGNLRTFLISPDYFPDLALDLLIPDRAGLALETRLGQWRLYFIGGYCLFILVLTIIFIVLIKQLQFAELKADFVSHVSHELKTPLTSLRMLSEIMAGQPRLSIKKRQQYYRIMNKESIRLSRLIENLLDISRIEKKKDQYYFQSENLDAVLRIALDIFSNAFLIHRSRLKISLQSSCRAWLDKDAIIQMMLNLLDNARKFSPPKSAIQVRSRIQDNQAVVQIIDQGAGMTASQLRKVFNKFYQVKKTYEDKFKGVGLGLAIVRNIVSAHRSKISITSALGRGTTVTITIPVSAPGD